MKKRILLIWALVAVLLLSSCAPNLSTENTRQQLSGQESTDGTTEPLDVGSRQDDGFEGASYTTFRLKSLEEYNAYFSKRDEKPNMVFYEDISQMGVFDTWQRVNDSYYVYYLRSADDYKFRISMEHKSYHSPLPEYTYVDLTAKEGDDLRVCSTQKRARLEYNGFTYTYVVGELLSIKWVENGIEFKIVANSTMADYPAGTDTFLGRLLDGSTYKATIDSIIDMKLTEGLPKGEFTSTITPVS